MGILIFRPLKGGALFIRGLDYSPSQTLNPRIIQLKSCCFQGPDLELQELGSEGMVSCRESGARDVSSNLGVVSREWRKGLGFRVSGLGYLGIFVFEM